MTTLLIFFLGASLGSFIGLVWNRFPEKSIVLPASHCDHCLRPLRIRDLIPLLSQLANAFRCPFCRQKISLIYFGIELICACITLLAYHHYLTGTQLFLLMFSLLLSLYDLDSQSYPIFLWFLLSLPMLFFYPIHLSTLILVLCSVLCHCYPLGIGSGDFLYFATLSLVLKTEQLLWLMQVSSLLGILFCLLFKCRKIPFLPFLSLTFLGLSLYEKLAGF
ncbi:prepilin peptidase [Streptococcus catagoni]|uniref:prepilin peptidase n=1 Tax=Streptococcus catagoni TaxID=2654874 RepID=UPI00140A48A1|nr:A24 family peptidase [Streptococcus catagoni]